MPNSAEIGRMIRNVTAAAAIGTAGFIGSGAPVEASPINDMAHRPELLLNSGTINEPSTSRFVVSEGAGPQAEKILFDGQALAQVAPQEGGTARAIVGPSIPWQEIRTGATEVNWGSKSMATAAVLGPMSLDQEFPQMKIAAHAVDLGDTPLFVDGQNTLIAARFSKPGGGEGLHYGAADPSRPDKKLIDVEVNGKGEVSVNIWTGQIGDATREKHSIGNIADYKPDGVYDLGLLFSSDMQSVQGIMGNTLSDPINLGGTVDSSDKLIAWRSLSAADATVDTLVIGHLPN